MRTQLRNKTKLYYANPTGVSVEVEDSDGYATGFSEAVYTEPTEYWMNVQPKGGEADIEIFGKTTDYSKVGIATLDCPITEYSRVWLDGKDPQTPHNYVVKRVNKSLTNCLIAFQEVKTAGVANG